MMRSDLFCLIQTVLQKGFPILLSFVDDALLLGLSKFGISFPGFEWLGALLLSATLLYWGWRILQYLYTKISVQSL